MQWYCETVCLVCVDAVPAGPHSCCTEVEMSECLQNLGQQVLHCKHMHSAISMWSTVPHDVLMFQLVSLQPFIVFPSCGALNSCTTSDLYGCRCLLVYLCELMTLSSGVPTGLPTWWHLETKAVNISFRGPAGPLHVRRRKGTDEENHWVRISPSVAATKLWALIKDSYVYVYVINYFSRSL